MSVRVMVVDDSLIIRRLVTRILEGEPDIEVVGSAANGRIALAKLARLRPDVITLDVEMPVMDGIATVRALRDRGSRVPVIMFSTLTRRGGLATLDALAAGATDSVHKPEAASEASLQQVRADLVGKVRALGEKKAASAAAPVRQPIRVVPRPCVRAFRPAELVVLGASTGGPVALERVLVDLGGRLSVPMLVVVHMPPMFTRLLAERLAVRSGLPVVEAAGGEPVQPGHVYVAPGDHHLELARGRQGLVTAVSQGPRENSCRPAVDPLFRSAAGITGAATLAVVLTGMGSDGCAGAAAIAEAGGRVVVQDEASSVVWGMPGSVARANLADETVPLSGMAEAIAARVRPAMGGGRVRHAGG